MKSLTTFKLKLLMKPFHAFFKFKLKKPLFVKGIKHHSSRAKQKNTLRYEHGLRFSLSHWVPFRKFKSVRRVDNRRIVSEDETEKMIFPSPVTPAFFNVVHNDLHDFRNRERVDEACRKFEDYLAEMIVEDGNIYDMMNLEEVLQYWTSLKCPLFVDMVSRFYIEMCQDMFVSENV